MVIKEEEILLGVISKLCDCLTDINYNYNPAVGREKEIEELMIAILTPKKSALLLGKAGVGKTSILEGLAYRIQKGDVPKALKNYIIYSTSGANLTSNCIYRGMMEKRVLDLFNALKNERNVILFIDEIHTLIGGGATKEDESMDIANIIKPFITSENINLVGATTTYEYDEYIQSDPAFSRRFSNIVVNEPSDEVLHLILMKTIHKYSQIFKIKVDNNMAHDVCTALVKYTKLSYRSDDAIVCNPDISISIIEKAFGYARLYDKNSIQVDDFINAYKTTDKVRGDINIPSTSTKHKDKLSKIISVNFKSKSV